MEITKDTIKTLPFAKTLISQAKSAFRETPNEIEIPAVLWSVEQRDLVDIFIEKSGRDDIKRGNSVHFSGARISEDGRLYVKVQEYQSKGMWTCSGYECLGEWEIDVTDIPEAYLTYYHNDKVKDAFMKVLSAEGYCPYDAPNGPHRIVVLPF